MQATSVLESGVSVVEIATFIKKEGDYLELCKKVVKSFEETGCLIIRDPRVNQADNDQVLDMMEKFFDSRSKKFYNKEKIADIFPEHHYQVGATPEKVEKARTHCSIVEKMTGDDKPMTECPPPFDAKWRYFWQIGEKVSLEEDALHLPQHTPSDFPEWADVMNKWGNLLLDCCETVATMLAIGLGFEEDVFTSRMKRAAHLLAPTGSDLARYDVGTIFAGFHYDLNFLTIHGKSRYPGLSAWLRNGKKVSVAVPDGCLLLQAGKQIEYLTGGHIKAGFHEVIYTEKTKQAVEKAKAEGRILWRISSTLFSQIRGDVILEPLGKFATEEAKKTYAPIVTTEQVMNELKAINLHGTTQEEAK